MQGNATEARETEASGRPLLRGLAYVNDVTVFRSLLGEAFMADVERRLTPEQRAAYHAGFEPSRWYEEDIQVRMSAALGDRFDEAGQFAIGVAVARHNINTAQRFLARIAGPRVLLSRASAVWSYWRNQGRMIVEDYREGAATVRVTHPPMAYAPYAISYGGCCAYIAAAGGAPNSRLRTEVLPGEGVVFHVRWSKKPGAEPGYQAVADSVEWLKRTYGV